MYMIKWKLCIVSKINIYNNEYEIYSNCYEKDKVWIII
jgi:hypothetical protein